MANIEIKPIQNNRKTNMENSRVDDHRTIEPK